MRSMLFVPAGDPAALDRALAADADALVIDLPDDRRDASVMASLPAMMETARSAAHQPFLLVRFTSMDDLELDHDLARTMAAEPDGLLLGRCRDGRDIQHLSGKLRVHEAEHGLVEAGTPIVAEAGSSAKAVLALAGLQQPSDRLIVLLWDVDALAADLGVEAINPPDPLSPLTLARSMVLMAAHAGGVSAIDGPSHCEGDALRAACERARQDGFNGKLASTADQVAVINDVFSRAI